MLCISQQLISCRAMGVVIFDLVRFFLMYFALEISNRCISVKYWNLEVIERPRVTLCNHLGLMLDEILIIILKKVFIFNRVTYVN